MLQIRAETLVKLPRVTTRKIDRTFQLEQWLNGPVATKAWKKFGIGLRFHFSLEEVKRKGR